MGRSSLRDQLERLATGQFPSRDQLSHHPAHPLLVHAPARLSPLLQTRNSLAFALRDSPSPPSLRPRFVQNHDSRGGQRGIIFNMQVANPPKRLEGPPLQASPPRQKASTLASIAIQSFSAFRSQTAQPANSPVRRKPLPANSPVVGRFPSAESNSRPNVTADRSNIQPSFSTPSPPPQGPQGLNIVLSPVLSEFDFLPRNLDE